MRTCPVWICTATSQALLKMSDELVQTINDAIKEAVETDTVKEGYKKLATTVEWVSPADSVEILQQCQNAYNEAYALTQG